MNCLEFRRVCLSHPRQLDAAQRAHGNDCSACSGFAAEQYEFDHALAAALAVPVPERLGTRVCFQRSLRGRRRVRWLASAAVLVLALGAALGVYFSLPTPMPIAAFVAHLQVDPLHEMPPDPAAAVELAQVSDTLDLGWSGGVGEVLRAKLCALDGHLGAHLVVENHGMRASAFVMPGLDVATAGRLRHAGMPGLIIETPQGVIAVFCPQAARLAELGARLRQAVHWQA